MGSTPQGRILFAEFPWAVLSNYESCSSADMFLNLVSGETIRGLDGEVHGLMIGEDGNPVILTDTGIYVLPPGSKTLEKRYEVRLPRR